MDKLLKRLAEIDARLNDLLAADEFGADQRTEHDKLVAERASLQERIDLKRQQDERAQASAADVERQRVEAERQRRQQIQAGRITTPDAPRAGQNPTVPAEPRVDDPRGGFATPREFLQSVMDWGRNVRHDDRLQRRMAVGSDEARGNSDPAGGFLIPRGFSPNLMQIQPEDDPIGNLTTKIPMSSPILDIPARVDQNHTTSVSGGLTVTRRPETVAGTPSQMTLSQVSLNAKCLFGLSYASEELLARSPISFVAILEQGFSQQFAAHLLNERLNGTGVGEYAGVCNSNANPCLISVAKESGQAAATIVKANIDKMRSRCWGYNKAVWLANHDCLPQLSSLVQIIGVGGSVVSYYNPTDMEDGDGTLLGRPIYFTEFTQTVGTVGDLVLGNWGEYLEGTLTPMQSDESIHVRFVNHERTFKFWTENCGVPWWKAALTPRNSSATLSPFVVLATRA